MLKRSLRTPAVAVAGALVLGTLIATGPASVAAERRCRGRTATIVGRAGQRVIKGTAKSDVIVGSPKSDVIVGGGGRDRICARGGDDRVRAGQGTDVVEGAAGDDRLKGGRGDDDLLGGDGRDRLGGGRSDSDFLVGGRGDDAVNGGRGSFDAVSYASAPGPVVVNLQIGVATGRGRDALRRVEDIVGSDFADRLTGTRSNLGNGFVGGPGNDSINGGGGPFDIVFFTTATGPVAVDLGSGTTRGAGTGSDALTDIDDAQGSGFDDSLRGGHADNFLWGAGGADTVHGRGGSDVLEGTLGNDSLDGGPGLDYVSYGRAHKRTRVDLEDGTATVGDRESDKLAHVEAALGSSRRDVLRGSQQPNQLFGFAGGDRISGLEGDDYLNGGRGRDRLNGGAGDDTCVDGERVSKCESRSQRETARLTARPMRSA
jgi:Ca2+-binding RTX toxin-like protein